MLLFHISKTVERTVLYSSTKSLHKNKIKSVTVITTTHYVLFFIDLFSPKLLSAVNVFKLAIVFCLLFDFKTLVTLYTALLLRFRYDEELGVVYMAARLAGGYAAVRRALNEVMTIWMNCRYAHALAAVFLMKSIHAEFSFLTASFLLLITD